MSHDDLEREVQPGLLCEWLDEEAWPGRQGVDERLPLYVYKHKFDQELMMMIPPTENLQNSTLYI